MHQGFPWLWFHHYTIIHYYCCCFQNAIVAHTKSCSTNASCPVKAFEMESLVSQGHSDHHYSGVPHTTRVSQCGSARNTRCNPFWCYPWWAVGVAVCHHLCHHKNAMRHCGQPCHIMWYGSCDVVSTAAYRVKRVIPRGCMTYQGIGTCLSVLPGWSAVQTIQAV